MPEKQEFHENLFLRCEECDLSARATHALWHMGVEIWAQLAALTEKQVSSVKNLGPKTLNEIKEIMAALEIRLGMFRSTHVGQLNEELKARNLPLITQWDEQRRHYTRAPLLPPHPPRSLPLPPGEPTHMEPQPESPRLSELLTSARNLLGARKSLIANEIRQFEQLHGSVALGLVVSIQEGQTPPAICAFLRVFPQPTIKQIEDHLQHLEEKMKTIEAAFATRGIPCLDVVIRALRVHEQYEQPL